MSRKENIAQPNSSTPDWSKLLSAEDLQNLAGFFDVLVEMDLEQKLNERLGDAASEYQRNTNSASKAS